PLSPFSLPDALPIWPFDGCFGLAQPPGGLTPRSHLHFDERGCRAQQNRLHDRAQKRDDERQQYVRDQKGHEGGIISAPDSRSGKRLFRHRSAVHVNATLHIAVSLYCPLHQRHVLSSCDHHRLSTFITSSRRTFVRMGTGKHPIGPATTNQKPVEILQSAACRLDGRGSSSRSFYCSTSCSGSTSFREPTSRRQSRIPCSRSRSVAAMSRPYSVRGRPSRGGSRSPSPTVRGLTRPRV